MAEESAPAEAAKPKRNFKVLVLTAIIGLASAAAGFAVPQLMGGGVHKEAADKEHAPETHAQDHARKKGLSCVPFSDVVANLDDHRMMRYVRAKFSLAVEEKDVESVTHVVEENRTMLKNWLIGYLQNKQIDEVRGTEGFNRIRREIQERFNELLFAGEEPKIKEVLFDEFNVQ